MDFKDEGRERPEERKTEFKDFDCNCNLSKELNYEEQSNYEALHWIGHVPIAIFIIIVSLSSPNADTVQRNAVWTFHVLCAKVCGHTVSQWLLLFACSACVSSHSANVFSLNGDHKLPLGVTVSGVWDLFRVCSLPLTSVNCRETSADPCHITGCKASKICVRAAQGLLPLHFFCM